MNEENHAAESLHVSGRKTSEVRNEETQKDIRGKIEKLRTKLLDLTHKNPLISTKLLSSRSNSYLHVVDELPDFLLSKLKDEQNMRFMPLPRLDEDPRDEQTIEFQNPLTNARLIDEAYLAGGDKIDPCGEEAPEQVQRLERELKDRVREQLAMPPRPTSTKNDSLIQHARNNGISPSYELPESIEKHEDGRHTDDDIQTLLLPDDLERKLRGLITKCSDSIRETGINVLRAAFGFLEWKDPERTSLSPLVLFAVKIEKKKTPEGAEFWVQGTGDEAETNTILAEKLQRDFGIYLPKYDGGPIEEYFAEIAKTSPKSLKWRVSRQIVFGVFPSARMAMYDDLDPDKDIFAQSEVISTLLGGSSVNGSGSFSEEYEIDQPEIEANVHDLVLSADSSQFRAMADIAKGKNLAIEGPPGTGKSQTIVNIIAAAIANEKKVLFVAEKTAALDVVKSRLKAVGLDEFVLPLQALQAGRSTRKEVIESVHKRMDSYWLKGMAATQSPKNYDSKVQKFKQARSELAAYIDAISGIFKETGFTIHDIIWKSIATNEVLDGQPKALNSEFQDVSAYDESRISSLRDLGAAVETAWREANAAKSHWRGHKLLSTNRISVDEACDLAKAAAQAYQSTTNARQKLADLDIDPRVTLPDLKSLKEALKALEGFVSSTSIEVDWISRVCREKLLKTVINFTERCRRSQAIQQELSQIFRDISDQNLPKRLQNIEKLCQKFDFDTLDASALQSKLFKDEELLSKLKKFVEILPESASFAIPEFIKARKLVCKTPHTILALRDERRANPAAAIIMTQAARKGKELCKRKAELERFVTTNISIDDLSACLAVIKSSGHFKIFSSSYRLAKKDYLSISRRGPFRNEFAIRDMQALIEWKKSEQDFFADQQTTTVFEPCFQGVNTNFYLFEQLKSYYENIEQEFCGIENREIRKFLKTCDLDLLMSIPEIGEEVEQKTFSELGLHIESANLDLKELMPLINGLKEPARIYVSSLSDLAQTADAHFRLKASLDENQEMRSLLGDHFDGASTNCKKLEINIKAAQTIMLLKSNYDIALSLLEKEKIREALAAIERVVQEDHNGEDAVIKLSQYTKMDAAHFSGGRTHAEIVDYLRAASEDKDGLYKHSKYTEQRCDLKDKGFDWVVTALLDEGLPLDNLGAILEAVMIKALVLEVYNIYGKTLGRFHGEKLNELRKQLADADRKIIEMSCERIKLKAYKSADPPPGNSRGNKSTWTDMALIENEISKKRAFIPMRALTERAGRALLELKPCWMMSPLAVAQYLSHGKIKFDLCIIDEASQMRPEDSLGALARSRQAVVVGDTNQLPPTNYFRKSNTDDEDADDEDAVDEESILEKANSAFRPKRRLRWHYRSRHSALIKFSNHEFYDDDLIIFPSASESKADMGVSLVSVNGRYHSSINEVEAQAMIDAALRFMRIYPDRSLGLVTMNQKQRELLLEKMDHSLAQDTAAAKYVDKWIEKNGGLESFFIKNLENVQGDERDVIFIGTAYGPEKSGGPVLQRFGPINQNGGARRLNVLFSRAKEQIVTFSSMTAANIIADENSKSGKAILKRWLEYSATGKIHTGDQTHREPDSDFERYVIDQIKSMGCEPKSQVGVDGYFIDIGVNHPQWPHGFIMGVECDGASWHSSKPARDRDRIRQEHLEGLGWHFYRIWSTDWFNDPQKEAGKLREAITRRLNHLKQDYMKKQSAAPFVAKPHIELSTQEEESEENVFSVTENAAAATVPLDSTPTADAPALVTQPESVNPSCIEVGDRVRVRYLSGTGSTHNEVTLSDKTNDPDRNVVHIKEPLGHALLGAEEGDEIKIHLREAIIERVTKSKTEGTNDEPNKNGDETRFAQTTSILFHKSSQSFVPNSKSKLNPDLFYESGYRRVIREYGSELIDALGPMTFRHISEKIARAHGFQSTGSRIKGQVWAAISRTRRSTRVPNGETVFWPDGLEPKKAISFRGLTIAGNQRSWQDVSYPEKLDLACTALADDDPYTAMAAKIGLSRLHQKTREELKALLKAAKAMTGING